LRLDYIFSGTHQSQHIALDGLMRVATMVWQALPAGEVPVEGNGQVTVRDHKSGEVIYRNSFSTLFQEWQQEPEALRVERSFENVFLGTDAKRHRRHHRRPARQPSALCAGNDP
jgi:hypothetical protein